VNLARGDFLIYTNDIPGPVKGKKLKVRGLDKKRFSDLHK
jgi:hypothetical protein